MSRELAALIGVDDFGRAIAGKGLFNDLSAEKQVISPFAIAGCYLFADSQQFLSLYDVYQTECPMQNYS